MHIKDRTELESAMERFRQRGGIVVIIPKGRKTKKEDIKPRREPNGNNTSEQVA